MKERIDKTVSQRGLLSRKDAASAVRAGRVLCNGALIKDPSAKIDPEASVITLDGEPLRKSRFVYIMMNKPEGVLSATEDKKDKTVLDLLPTPLSRRNLGVCGRLDRDAEGLLLLTDDGNLNHKITSPKTHVSKLYMTVLDKEPPKDAVSLFEKGMDLGDFTTLPATLSVNGKECLTEISEGKFHQIKRMFKKVGCTVLKLKRLKIGNLSLDEALSSGEWRMLTDEETENLLNLFR